jgi:DNA gyrase subunit A
VVSVRDDDEVLMISARGKIQRVAVSDVSVIGRNTQGVRIMSLDEGDTLAAIVRVPPDADADNAAANLPGPTEPEEETEQSEE